MVLELASVPLPGASTSGRKYIAKSHRALQAILIESLLILSHVTLRKLENFMTDQRVYFHPRLTKKQNEHTLMAPREQGTELFPNYQALSNLTFIFRTY